ncbi:unnamed protein product [Phaedon cochleariae]|uniref:Uncharacterized protein n=1 Tax=Phaedon cochleariae TaxID=80249 RepID=A0A9N9SDS5_PHACE|nr:unnamed protein product [Phaedon cochleariae]
MQTIAELNKELIKQTELNRHLMTEVDFESAVEEWLQKDIQDLEISKQNMLKVIESLSQENELFTTELRELRNKNDIMKTKSERTSNTIRDEILGTERKKFESITKEEKKRNDNLKEELKTLQFINDNFVKEMSFLIEANERLYQEIKRLEKQLKSLQQYERYTDVVGGETVYSQKLEPTKK